MINAQTSCPRSKLERATVGAAGGLILATLFCTNVEAQAPTDTPPPAPAIDEALASEDASTTRGLALGTGVRASALSTAAHAYNPANLPVGRLYHVEGSVAYVPSVERWGLEAAVVDSASNRLAGGLSFRGILGNGSEGYSGYDTRLSLGFPASDAVGLGVAGRYLNLSRDSDGEQDGQELAEGFTFDAAFRLTPTEGIHIAGLGYNLIDVHSALAPRRVGGSAAIAVGDTIIVGADLLFDLTTYDDPEMTVGGGVELLAGEQIPLRAGYVHDAGRGVHRVSGGLGYIDQLMGLELAMTQEVSGGNATTVVASLRYFVSAGAATPGSEL